VAKINNDTTALAGLVLLFEILKCTLLNNIIAKSSLITTVKLLFIECQTVNTTINKYAIIGDLFQKPTVTHTANQDLQSARLCP